jgi:hypothetical protein
MNRALDYGILEVLEHAMAYVIELLERYDPADLSLFSGVARAAKHQCSPGSARDDYNEVRIRQLPGEPQQRITWLELRIEPR